MTLRRDNKPFLGILMLDTAFPRLLGDAGNPQSYGFPARTRIVRGAGSLDVVRDELIPELLTEAFCDAARKLEAEGAVAIVSTCGFLVTVQPRIAAAVNIPVMMSALSLYPSIKTTIGDAALGILTASGSSLGDLALKSAGIKRANVRIAGFEDCPAFSAAILQEKARQTGIDAGAIELAAVSKARSLVAATPDIGAFLLECGNLPPYAAAIKKATGRPVFSILDGAELLWNASSGHWPIT